MGKSIGLTVVILGMVAFGIWNIRQSGLGDAIPPEVIQKRFDSIPKRIGLWHGSDCEINTRHMNAAGYEAYVCRSYENQQTKARVSVMLLYGKPGDLAAHDPELCYRGSGYHELTGRTKRQLKSGELWSTRFGNSQNENGKLEVCWGWTINGNVWEAPDAARYAFADHRRVVKIYAQQSVEDAGKNDLREFLDSFYEEFTKALNAANEP